MAESNDHSDLPVSWQDDVVRDVANTRLVRARVCMAETLGHWREFVGG